MTAAASKACAFAFVGTIGAATALVIYAPQTPPVHPHASRPESRFRAGKLALPRPPELTLAPGAVTPGSVRARSRSWTAAPGSPILAERPRPVAAATDTPAPAPLLSSSVIGARFIALADAPRSIAAPAAPRSLASRFASAGRAIGSSFQKSGTAIARSVRAAVGH